MRDLAAEGHIQAVLVYSPDRLSRKYAYQVLLTEEFGRYGVDTVFVKSPQSATPECQLLLHFHQLTVGFFQLLNYTFEFSDLTFGFLSGNPLLLLKSPNKLLILAGNCSQLVVHHFPSLVHCFPSPLLPLSFNSIPAHSAISFQMFSRNFSTTVLKQGTIPI